MAGRKLEHQLLAELLFRDLLGADRNAGERREIFFVLLEIVGKRGALKRDLDVLALKRCQSKTPAARPGRTWETMAAAPAPNVERRPSRRSVRVVSFCIIISSPPIVAQSSLTSFCNERSGSGRGTSGNKFGHAVNDTSPT